MKRIPVILLLCSNLAYSASILHFISVDEVDAHIPVSTPDVRINSFRITMGITPHYLESIAFIPKADVLGVSFTQTYLLLGGIHFTPTTGVCEVDVLCTFGGLHRFINANGILGFSIFGEIVSASGSGHLYFELPPNKMNIQDLNNNFRNQLSSAVDGQTRILFDPESPSSIPEPANFILTMLGTLLLTVSRRKNG